MEQLIEPGINLFSDTLPSLEELKTLSGYLNSDDTLLMNLDRQIEENAKNASCKSSGALGIGLYILGRDEQAIENLKKANDSQQKYIYMAYALRRLGKFDEAIENFLTSLKHGADSLSIT